LVGAAAAFAAAAAHRPAVAKGPGAGGSLLEPIGARECDLQLVAVEVLQRCDRAGALLGLAGDVVALLVLIDELAEELGQGQSWLVLAARAQDELLRLSAGRAGGERRGEGDQNE